MNSDPSANAGDGCLIEGTAGGDIDLRIAKAT
jgi:hypothetical protein